MNKQLLGIGIVVLIITVIGLIGCTEAPSDNVENKFIGTWKKQNAEQNLTFSSDKTVPNFIGSITGTWVTRDGRLVITISISQVSFDLLYDFGFSNDDKTLTLTLIEPKDVGYDDTAGTYLKQ